MKTNELQIFGVRLDNDQLIAVKTNLPDLLTYNQLLSMIRIDGVKFWILVNNKRIDFKFDENFESLEKPTPEQLKCLTQL